MKLLILILAVALALGGLVGTLVIRDPGYVLVAYDQMAVETSLWFAVLVLVAAYVVIRFLVFLLARLGRGRISLRDWKQARRLRRAESQTVKGLLLMAEGDWQEARRRLESAADRVDVPLVNYLNAARAAHAMGDSSGRDALLSRAHESTPGARLAVGLTQAELQYDSGQWEQCLATLLQLRSAAPHHPQVLRLLADCYVHLEDWTALVELLPELRKRKALTADALAALERDAWRGRLASGAVTGNGDLKALWRQVPRSLQREPALVGRYVAALVDRDDASEAEQVLRSALNHRWEDSLVRLYGTVQSEDPGRQLVVAEGWLKERPSDSELLLALGRISLMNHLWAKAREYLEASLRLRRTPEVQGELGRLCAALGDADRGSEHLKEALAGLPALPLPEPASQAEAAG